MSPLENIVEKDRGIPLNVNLSKLCICNLYLDYGNHAELLQICLMCNAVKMALKVQTSSNLYNIIMDISKF